MTEPRPLRYTRSQYLRARTRLPLAAVAALGIVGGAMWVAVSAARDGGDPVSASTPTLAPSTSTVTVVPTSPPTSAAPSTAPPTPTSSSVPPTTTPPTTTPPPATDPCPTGDWTGNPVDGDCGTPPTDPCGYGDYSGSATDGTCGTPPQRDNCPAGDYSGNAYDGHCGTPPTSTTLPATTTTAAPAPPPNTPPRRLTLRFTITCTGDSQLAVYASGTGIVDLAVSGPTSASNSGESQAEVTLDAPAGSYLVEHTADSGGGIRPSEATWSAVGGPCTS